MGSCKFKIRKENYEHVLNTISNLDLFKNHVVLGDTKYQFWVESRNRYCMDSYDQNADILTSINYIGDYELFTQYIDRIMDPNDLLYVISKKDLDKILISRDDLIKELKIKSDYASLEDFLEDIKDKTGFIYQIEFVEKLALSKEIIISKILDAVLRQVAENIKNEFLFSLPWGGYKRNPRDRYEL